MRDEVFELKSFMRVVNVKEGVVLFEDAVSIWRGDESESFSSLGLGPSVDGASFHLDLSGCDIIFVEGTGNVDIGSWVFSALSEELRG